MKKLFLLTLLLASGIGLWFVSHHPESDQATEKPEKADKEESGPYATMEGRYEYELARLADPATGEIPSGIHMRELAFASRMPQAGAQRGELSLNFESIGPYNVGGRTRAFAIDNEDNEIYLAGGVSGGMWRSTDAGMSWDRVTAPEEHAAVSCILQDPRPGKSDNWYYGSGEVIGNSASKSFSATYRGNGIYTSTDGGLTWNSMLSTIALQHKASDWDAVFRVLVDPTRTDSTILLAAVSKGIMRSNDNGQTWAPTIGGNLNVTWTDISVTTDGVFYAAIQSNTTGSAGFWRSDDGLNWTNITPSGFPSHQRTVMAIPAINENIVYFLSSTSGSGKDGNSLWRYEYQSGDGSGSGGMWENRTNGLPNEGLNLFNGYCQVVAVKPDDPDLVFVGGTSLFRSTNGFTDTNQILWAGGYRVEGDTNFNFRSGVHYPDQQSIFFDQEDPDRMISTTDGGIHRTDDCTTQFITWERLSRGYVTSQFYGIGIDHATVGSEEVMGGLQDRGTFWTNTADDEVDWVSVRGADGAYVWITDGGSHHYMSTQYANIQRSRIDDNGEKEDAVTVMPEEIGRGSGAGWLFVHPFTLDPVDNNVMYLPHENDIWVNTNLAAADLEDLSFWSRVNQTSGGITAIAASENIQGTVYWGTSSKLIYKMEDGHLSSATIAEEISNGISNGAYTSCIAIDPADADKVIVVYSNYNTISLWYSEDGGDTWTDIEGNLKGTPEDGVPAALSYIGDGPSIRWAEIAPTEGGNVYFIGTSVGLFSTRELNGDSTVWKQEGIGTIGNVVVDMLDYRAEDQWLVVGTHGNGIYATNIDFVPSTGIADTKGATPLSSMEVFPNPASDVLNVSYTLAEQVEVSITLFDASGRSLRTWTLGEISAGSHQNEINLTSFPSGVYYCSMHGEGIHTVRKVVHN